MAGKLKETLHVSVPLVATSMNNTNETGQYIPIDRCSRLLAILHGGAADATKSWKLELLEATDNAGTGAAAITSATATGTANTKVKKATVALDSAANTDTVTVTAYVGSTVAETATYTKAASANAAENKFDDVVSYAKNTMGEGGINFKIEYQAKDGNIREYYPDFFVKTDGGRGVQRRA